MEVASGSEKAGVGVCKQLRFDIFSCSSFSNNFRPEYELIEATKRTVAAFRNVLNNEPGNQNSRWSSDSSEPTQHLTMRLRQAAVVKQIRFGKFEKTHVCNLKRFKVFGGLVIDSLVELLDSGLRNDSATETFSLRHVINGKPFPCVFLKIVPLQSWGPSFNYSIWYVQLLGDDSDATVLPSLCWYSQYRETEATRVCLKFLRDGGHVDLFDALQTRTGVVLEHPSVHKLRRTLVVEGDHAACEQIVEQCADDGAFDEFVARQPYTADWAQVEAVGSQRPGVRGGHQMLVDAHNGTPTAADHADLAVAEAVYVFGGWDGVQELADLWRFDVSARAWRCLCENAEECGGPSPRSCHKTVLDGGRQQIFTLGRFVDVSSLSVDAALSADFYLYDIDSDRWQLISDDTEACGGPGLLLDHQLAIDLERHTIYCFGGVVVEQQRCQRAPSAAAAQLKFGHLFSYSIADNCWTLLRRDSMQTNNSERLIKSRSGHSMVFCPASRRLFIMGGQRGKEQLSDMLVYDVDADELSVESDAAGMPLRSLSRALTELRRFDGRLGSIRNSKTELHPRSVSNSLWVCKITDREWSCIYQSEPTVKPKDNALTKQTLSQLITARKQLSQAKSAQPQPRYAHQLVYDEQNKIHYLFGGNPGKPEECYRVRLDDFWRLRLRRPLVDDVLHQCRWRLRCERYVELLAVDEVRALAYLQTEVASLANHADVDQLHALGSRLFDQRAAVDMDENRAALLNDLLSYFPQHMRPPERSLVDMIKL